MTEENKNGENHEEINLSAEELAALEESEKFIEGFKEEDLNDPDKSEELAKHLKNAKTTINQKRHFRDKVTTLEKQIQDGTKKPDVPAKPKDGEDKKGLDPTIALEFRQDHPELSKEVAKEICEHAKAYGITPEEALAKPVMQSYVKSTQKKDDIEDASIGEGKKGSVSEIAKRDWSTASEAEIVAQRNKIQNGQ